MQFNQHREPFPAAPGCPHALQAGMCSLPINPGAQSKPTAAGTPQLRVPSWRGTLRRRALRAAL